ncbi:MAG: DoxX family membrane protein [Cyclobacteriaceae bacterium]
MQSETISRRDKAYDYFILTARFLLGAVFISYGYSKLVEGQFGITEEEMLLPLNELSHFKVSWYLFDQQPFKYFVGISQIICGILLLINRTLLLGAFMFLPIVTTILIMDMTFMPPALAEGFTWRLTSYILLDFLIIWHYRERMIQVWHLIWEGISTKYRHRWYKYILLPVLAFILEFALAIPKILFKLLTDWSATIESFGRLF